MLIGGRACSVGGVACTARRRDRRPVKRLSIAASTAAKKGGRARWTVDDGWSNKARRMWWPRLCTPALTWPGRDRSLPPLPPVPLQAASEGRAEMPAARKTVGERTENHWADPKIVVTSAAVVIPGRWARVPGPFPLPPHPHLSLLSLPLFCTRCSLLALVRSS